MELRSLRPGLPLPTRTHREHLGGGETSVWTPGQDKRRLRTSPRRGQPDSAESLEPITPAESPGCLVVWGGWNPFIEIVSPDAGGSTCASIILAKCQHPGSASPRRQAYALNAVPPIRSSEWKETGDFERSLTAPCNSRHEDGRSISDDAADCRCRTATPLDPGSFTSQPWQHRKHKPHQVWLPGAAGSSERLLEMPASGRFRYAFRHGNLAHGTAFG